MLVQPISIRLHSNFIPFLPLDPDIIHRIQPRPHHPASPCNVSWVQPSRRRQHLGRDTGSHPTAEMASDTEVLGVSKIAIPLDVRTTHRQASAALMPSIKPPPPRTRIALARFTVLRSAPAAISEFVTAKSIGIFPASVTTSKVGAGAGGWIGSGWNVVVVSSPVSGSTVTVTTGSCGIGGGNGGKRCSVDFAIARVCKPSVRPCTEILGEDSQHRHP